MKKIAIITPAYKDESLITACVEQFKPYGLRHLVLVSTKPWGGGTPKGEDFTALLARDAGAEVYTQYWTDEVSQRNWGLAYLYDYDYVITIDADEFFIQKDIQRMLDVLNNLDEPCFRTPKIKTYWKTPEYRLEPGDQHQPVIVVNPKKCKFYTTREIAKIDDNVPEMWRPIMPIDLHHFSFVRPDNRIEEKLDIFSSIENVDFSWYDNVWKKWTPESKENVRPWGIEKSGVIKDPAPEEIIDLYDKNVDECIRLGI